MTRYDGRSDKVKPIRYTCATTAWLAFGCVVVQHTDGSASQSRAILVVTGGNAAALQQHSLVLRRLGQENGMPGVDGGSGLSAIHWTAYCEGSDINGYSGD